MPKLSSAHCDAPCMLLVHTRKLLKSETRSLPAVANVTGIPFYWLKSFSEGRARNPSVNRTVFLYNFLSGKNLKF